MTETPLDEWAEHLKELGYPTRLTVDIRNKNWRDWQDFFDRQYLDECARLNIEITPVQVSLL